MGVWSKKSENEDFFTFYNSLFKININVVKTI